MVEPAGRRIDAQRLSTFRDAFGGQLVLPGDDNYHAARAVWNGMIDRRPAIVVRPVNAADVIAALRFARDEDLIVAVRSGGHSMAGLSTCDDGIIIDLAPMRGVTVDPDRRVARCNGGALLGELDDAAQEFGLACNVGTVSHTGIAGLTLAGGWLVVPGLEPRGAALQRSRISSPLARAAGPRAAPVRPEPDDSRPGNGNGRVT